MWVDRVLLRVLNALVLREASWWVYDGRRPPISCIIAVFCLHDIVFQHCVKNGHFYTIVPYICMCKIYAIVNSRLSCNFFILARNENVTLLARARDT